MMEDVDARQLELEAMLAATVVKKRTIAHEIMLINDIELHSKRLLLFRANCDASMKNKVRFPGM